MPPFVFLIIALIIGIIAGCIGSYFLMTYPLYKIYQSDRKAWTLGADKDWSNGFDSGWYAASKDPTVVKKSYEELFPPTPVE